MLDLINEAKWVSYHNLLVMFGYYFDGDTLGAANFHRTSLPSPDMRDKIVHIAALCGLSAKQLKNVQEYDMFNYAALMPDTQDKFPTFLCWREP